ncbi:MAG: DUF1592 domain-containing protein [Myxococcota bacterium]
MRWACSVVLVAALGCQGQFSSPGGPGRTSGPGPDGPALTQAKFFNAQEAYEHHSFAESCDPAAEPSVRPLLRLTKRELERSLRDVLTELLGTEAGTAAFGAIETDFATMPADEVSTEHHGLFANAETVVQATYFEAMLPVARELGTVGQDLLGACDEERACFERFLQNEARQIYRRPLGDEDVAHYLSVYDEGGLEVAVSSLFMAPQFLFHTEYEHSVGEGSFALDPYERASRLSFALWETSPDPMLLDAAASGELETTEGFRAQAERLFYDPRSEESIRHFISEWLELDSVALIDLDNARARLQWETEAGAPTELDGAALRQEAIDEIEDLIIHFIFEASSDRFSNLLQTRLSNAGPLLSEAIYGEGDPARDADGRFELTDPNRQGILGRAGFHLIDGANRRPIMKGVRLLERVLCREIAPPADNATPPEAELEDTFTTRERTTAITEIEGTSCAGCHGVINPLGFSLETFDAFGRVSEIESIVSPTEAEPTDFVAERAVDPTATVQLNGEGIAVEGPEDLSQAISESFEAHQCFSRFWWRYINRREENLDRGDACHLQAIYEGLENGGRGLDQALLDGILHAHFRTR